MIVRKRGSVCAEYIWGGNVARRLTSLANATSWLAGRTELLGTISGREASEAIEAEFLIIRTPSQTISALSSRLFQTVVDGLERRFLSKGELVGRRERRKEEKLRKGTAE
jgi:hypothetical protein